MDNFAENVKSDRKSAAFDMDAGVMEGMNISDSLVAAGLITPEAGCLFLLRL